MKLNPEQQTAMETIEGAVLISAAPGSGKTRTVIERIKHILKQGYSPVDILAVTFTNSAAHEMRERLEKDLPEDVVRELTICTFHRLTMQIIRRYGYKIGRKPDFSIYDTDDQLDIIRAIMKDLGIKKPKPESVMKSKNNPKYKMIFTEYRDRLRAVNAFDFDMLIDSAMFILENHEEARKELQHKFRFISVDEFQDVNTDQYRMANILAKEWGNICAVGDTDQNIFSFAGSDVKFMLQFQEEFDNTKVVTIDTTYRCPEAVMGKATDLVKHNPNRLEVTPKTVKAGGVLKRLVFDNDFEEACWIAKQCHRLIDGGEAKDNEIAVLCRTHKVSGTIAQVMRNGGLEVNMCGRTRDLMSQTAAKDFNAYIRLIANQYDKYSLQRVSSAPNRDLTWRHLASIEALSRASDVDLLTAAKQYLATKKLDTSWVDEISALKSLTFSEAASTIETILRDFYDTQNLITRSKDLLSLGGVINDMVCKNPHLTAADYLEEIAELSAQNDATSEKEGVNIMTVHTSKGLEWPFVFVPAMEMGTFPIGSNPNEEALEEERRLFYVALTRAERGVYVTSSRARTFWGKEREVEESLFIAEAGI